MIADDLYPRTTCRQTLEFGGQTLEFGGQTLECGGQAVCRKLMGGGCSCVCSHGICYWWH